MEEKINPSPQVHRIPEGKLNKPRTKKVLKDETSPFLRSFQKDNTTSAILTASNESSANSLKSYHQRDPITPEEVYSHLKNIKDPEYPYSLEELKVVTKEDIIVENRKNGNQNVTLVTVNFTPTVPHCTMVTLIGLSILVKLLRSLPKRVKITVNIKEGTHNTVQEINKQLNDKERIMAALEQDKLLKVVENCLNGI